MLELLVALSIMVTALVIIWSTFNGTLKAWTRGNELLDELHHGDFVIEQLINSLRSAAYFKTSPGAYGFRLKSRGGNYAEDEISWVTSGTAFIPHDSPLLNGLYRIHITIENNDEGDDSVAVRAWPYLAEITEDDVDPWFVSTRVKGINCRTYNEEDEAWEDAWEDTNTIPSLVEITLFMDPLEKYGEPVKIKRLVEIPIAPSVTSAVNFVEGPAAPAKESGPGEQAPVTSPTEAVGP